MNAPLNAQALAGLQVAEWKSLAALTGKTFAQVACDAMKARVGGRKVITAAEAWMSLSDRTRGFLVMLATERGTADRVRWDQLTEKEKFAIGAMARTTLGELSAYAGLLRA